MLHKHRDVSLIPNATAESWEQTLVCMYSFSARKLEAGGFLGLVGQSSQIGGPQVPVRDLAYQKVDIL